MSDRTPPPKTPKRYDWSRLTLPWCVEYRSNRNGTTSRTVMRGPHIFDSPAIYRIDAGRIVLGAWTPDEARASLDELETQLKQCEVLPQEDDPLLRSVPLAELERIVEARRALDGQ